MKFDLSEVYQIKSGASQKKIYRFKNHNKKGVFVDFSYNYKDYHSFLEVNKFLSTVNISVPKIFDIDDSKNLILMELLRLKTQTIKYIHLEILTQK